MGNTSEVNNTKNTVHNGTQNYLDKIRNRALVMKGVNVIFRFK